MAAFNFFIFFKNARGVLAAGRTLCFARHYSYVRPCNPLEAIRCGFLTAYRGGSHPTSDISFVHFDEILHNLQGGIIY